MLFPLLVDLLEHLGLSRQLFDDIFSVENVFQIHPLALEFQPFVDDISKINKLAFHGLDGASDFLDEFAAHHGGHSHGIVFKSGDKVLYLSNDESLFLITILNDDEVDFFPALDDELHGVLNLHFTLGGT